MYIMKLLKWFSVVFFTLLFLYDLHDLVYNNSVWAVLWASLDLITACFFLNGALYKKGVKNELA